MYLIRRLRECSGMSLDREEPTRVLERPSQPVEYLGSCPFRRIGDRARVHNALVPRG